MRTKLRSRETGITRRAFIQHSTTIAAGLVLTIPMLPDSAVRAASATAGEDISIVTALGKMPAYVARPTGQGPFPGVIVCHDWYGLHQGVKSAAERLAQAGFVALAPNFYRGQPTTDSNHALLLSQNLRLAQAFEDLEWAVNYLVRQEGAAQVGLLAFSYSDGLAFAVAQSSLPIEQIAILYGGNASPNADVYGTQTGLAEVRLANIHPAMRFSRNRHYGPLVLNGDSAQGVPSESWDQAIRWLKRNAS